MKASRTVGWGISVAVLGAVGVSCSESSSSGPSGLPAFSGAGDGDAVTANDGEPSVPSDGGESGPTANGTDDPTLPAVGQCADGLTSCTSSALGAGQDTASCVDLATSGSHCGSCGNLCPIGQVCSAGGCSATCAPGLTACGSSCVDTQLDADNCGTCGLQCGGGTCEAGSCPAGKLCASKATLQSAQMADFEAYDGVAAADTFGFAFNGPGGSPLAVYAGTYQYGDGTGAQGIEMVPGNGSQFAVRIANDGATDWGGALGLWMGCVDASEFDGIRFAARGSAPGGVVSMALATESTSAPGEDDPATGGTCLDGCAAPSADFPISGDWTPVLLPWSAFAPGSANGSEVVLSGDELTGMTFSIALEWAEVAGQPGVYGPVTSGYELAIDDIEFFRTSDVCADGENVCASSCVVLDTNDDHCGACGNACTGGSSCQPGQGCVCPAGQTFCAGECADLNTAESHCGACGNFCAIGAECQNGSCTGGNATTSNRCGRTTQLLGNPLGCEFGWGANLDNGIPGYLDFATKWVGYEPNVQTRCDGCDWLRRFNSPAVPTYIAYFGAYRANIEAGLGDCNLDFDGNNLCTGGAQFLRANHDRLVDIYASYAARSYAVISNRPVIWIIEPDFSQYAEPTQQNPLSMQELGSLATDIICAIKSNMPNAVIALNHSTWLAGDELQAFWNAMPVDLIDMLHITSRADVPGGYFNDSDANNRNDGTFAFLNQLTGKPIIADTSFGVTTMQDSWSSANQATLNARIDDGVVGVLIFPQPGDYQQRINGLAPGLASTCQ